MREVSGDLDLAEKPLGTDGGGEFGPQDLHGNPAVVLQVPCEIDRGHAAAADFLLYGVAVR